MAEITWIKLHTGLFDNEKIQMIESMKDGDSIIVMWVKLIVLAGKLNNDGIFITDSGPYTPSMFASVFHRPVKKVKAALDAFLRFNMIETDENGTVSIRNWELYQNIDGMQKVREQTRKRVEECRKRKRRSNATGNEDVTQCNVTGNATVTQCNGTDKEKDIKNKKKENTKKESVTGNVTDDALIRDPDRDRKTSAALRYQFFSDYDLDRIFKVYLKRRRLDREAADFLVARLSALCNAEDTRGTGIDVDTAKQIVARSIESNWNSFYPLKEQKTEKNFSNFEERNDDIDAFSRDEMKKRMGIV